jgi:hypothetical protein
MALFHIEDSPSNSLPSVWLRKKIIAKGEKMRKKNGRKSQFFILCGQVGENVANFLNLSLCNSGGSQYS